MKKKKNKINREKIKKHLNIKIKLKEESSEKSNKEKNDRINNLNSSEEIQFRKFSLEEIIPSLKENEINIESRTIIQNQKIEQETTGTPIYDINNSIRKSDYHSISNYQSSSENYNMNQISDSSFIPLLNSSEQDIGLNQKDDRSYELSREKELRDKKRRMW